MEDIKFVPVPPNIIKEKWNEQKQCWEESITEEERMLLYKKEIEKLENIFIVEKMKIENVFNDFMNYMEEKALYDKQQEKQEQDRQLAYQEVLKASPNLTYEEFLAAQPVTMALEREPQPSPALQDFMKKYL